MVRQWLLLLLSVSALAAQQTRSIRGTLVLDSGQPVAGANVFVLETLEGALSDSLGRFTFQTRAQGRATIVVRGLGLLEQRLPLPDSNQLRIVLQSEAVPLPALQVLASRFAIGDAPDAVLNSIQVVSTPGASADVYRALQTFPGLQFVDEGAGLFVRGGDVAETRIFLNDAVVLSPYRYESPTGGFFGAFDPFSLDGIAFSSGGFGARYGDALSGIAALRTLGRPERLNLGATASLASLSATVNLPVGPHLGVRGTLTRSHTELLFRVNGTSTEFTREPEGRDASVNAVWSYPNGELRLFAIDQWNQLGVFLDQPSFDGALDSEGVHDAYVLSWQHGIRSGRVRAVAASAGATNQLSFGTFDLRTRDRLRQLRTEIEWPLALAVGVTAGLELREQNSSMRGQSPTHAYDPGPGAPTRVIRAEIDDTHISAYFESDWTPSARLRVIAGLRSDRSELAEQATADPRLSVAYRVAPSLTLTAAWGIYHQVPAPELYDRALETTVLPPMRAEHRILGAQLGAEQALLLRVEAYQKRYRDLADPTRDRDIVTGGLGRTHGLDAFLQWPAWKGFSGRTSYSYLRARRTDPDTRLLATSPFDITHTVTSVLQRSFGAWQVSVAHRSATGRPFTPVTSAQFDSSRHVWVPTFGPPNSERLPAFQRIDASMSRLVPLPHQRLIVLFLAANNILDRRNVYDYRYDAAYTQRTPVRSQFNRSIYFGATLSW
jgi:vitamin B12 transporter